MKNSIAVLLVTMILASTTAMALSSFTGQLTSDQGFVTKRDRTAMHDQRLKTRSNNPLPSGPSVQNKGIIVHKPAGAATKGIIVHKPKQEKGIIVQKPNEQKGIIVHKPTKSTGAATKGIIVHKPKETKGIILDKPSEQKASRTIIDPSFTPKASAKIIDEN
ncbi:hypothetical protein HY641_01180 [Candidatus Woesearchaeota archaeon]|nr:hypothetical protein [Candidatus Woesearchaeota archaeon]